MKAILREFIGKKIEVNCGSSVAFRGEVVSVESGVLNLLNEEQQKIFIAVEKIAAVCECRDLGSRPGFIV